MTDALYDIRAVERIDNRRNYTPVNLSKNNNCSWSVVRIYDMMQGSANPSGRPVAEFKDVSTQDLIALLQARYSAEGAPERRGEFIYGEPFGEEGNKIFRREKTGKSRRLRIRMLDALASGELRIKTRENVNK